MRMSVNAHLVQINDRLVGDGQPCWIVAEVGVNHDGVVEQAVRLIEAAAEAGADAVKFQRRDPATLLTREALEAPYAKPGSFGETYGLHRAALELPADGWPDLAATAFILDLDFFASAWDHRSVDALVAFRWHNDAPACCALKVPSACLTDLPLLDHMAQTGLPLVMSTGMADMDDVEAAVAAVLRHHDQLVLMACTASYPAENSDLNLRTIQTLKERFELPVGWSGHERGVSTSVCAVALGANVVERHFTLDRTLPGPDHAASLEPPGFRRLVRDIRNLEVALGDGVKRVLPAEASARARLAKSVVTARAIAAGTVLGPEDLTIKGPGTGLSPRLLPELIGRVAPGALEVDVVVPKEAMGWPKGGDRLP